VSCQGPAIASGAIAVAGDLDFYRFSAPANSRVWIYVDTGGALIAGSRDSTVELLGTDGTTVIEADDDDGTSNGMDGTVETGFGSAVAGRLLATPGDYYVRVRGFGVFPGTDVVNPYKLFVQVTALDNSPLGETEPNDTAGTANPLLTSAGTKLVDGSIANGQTDFYSVTVNSGDLLYVNLDGDPERDGTGTDTELSLRDAGGTLVGSLVSDSINVGNATNPPAENFAFLFNSSGTFTLRVFGFGGSGSYRLMANLSSPGPDLMIAKSHLGIFTQGQTGAQYSIFVTNVGVSPTLGLITVTDTLPAPLVATAIGGTGWSCTQPSGPCTRSDPLGVGLTYPSIILTVDVPPGTATLTNTAQVTGTSAGPAANNITNDFTPIISPSSRSWTIAASTSTVKENSVQSVFLNATALGFDPLGIKTGTITAHQSMTATRGLSAFCPATESTIKVRFRDSDGPGNAAQVSFDIHAIEVSSGADSIVYSFDSNLSGAPVDNGFHTVSVAAPLDFDFLSRAYWIELKVRRDNTLLLANIGAIQIWESAGTGCP
jgi:hypothetical protein